MTESSEPESSEPESSEPESRESESRESESRESESRDPDAVFPEFSNKTMEWFREGETLDKDQAEASGPEASGPKAPAPSVDARGRLPLVVGGVVIAIGVVVALLAM